MSPSAGPALGMASRAGQVTTPPARSDALTAWLPGHTHTSTAPRTTSSAAWWRARSRRSARCISRFIGSCSETVPDVASSVDCVDGQIGYGARQFGYDGWGMAALAPFTNWVSLAFLRGARLEDPDELLEGTGAGVRHVKLRSTEQLAQTADGIRRLLEQAVRLGQVMTRRSAGAC